MRLITSDRARHAFLVLVLSLGLAGDAWRYSAGWWVFGVLAVLTALASVALLIVQRRRWSVGGLPYPLLAFLLLATASIAWSAYPGATALGLLTTWMLAVTGVALAVTYSWRELLRGVGALLRIVLAASLLFELFVAVVLRRPVLPLWVQPGVDYSQYETIPKMLYWSRNELVEVLDEGRIQGIVGNANHLGFLALLAAIVFAIELADRSLRRRWHSIAWLVVAAVTLVCTRSATVTVALVATAAVIGIVLLLRRETTPRARRWTYAGLLAAALAAITVVVLARDALLALLGKSPDLTGRLGIWEKVIALAQERPAFGWGWVSYWVPWAEPFQDLAFRNGVRMLQAHNAWIDVWFQLGVVGLIVFGALVLSTLVRSWFAALDRPQHLPDRPLPFRALSLLPLAIMTALVVQSLAESRLLVEFGMLFLVLIAVKTKSGDTAGELR
ncbi:O-antigen ligase family protein [Schumannella luteola]